MKSILKRVLRRYGVDLRHYSPSTSLAAQRKAILDHHCVNVVLDIGANTGGYGRMLRESGYRGRIVSFEALSSAHKTLRAAAKGDNSWEVAPRVAIGSDDCEATLNISQNMVSSSLLAMAEAHVEAAPDSFFVGRETVPVRRLDSIVDQFLGPESIAFLKADTQGYEDRVLSGSRETLTRLVGLELELSFYPIYEQQTLFFEMIEKHIPRTFELWGIWPEFTNNTTGRLLAVDAIFMRAS